MGAKIFETVCEATGLPQELIQKELKTLLETEGMSSDEVTVEELRSVLAKYLQEVLSGAKENY